MGSPLAPTGAAASFVSGNEALRDKGRDQAYRVRSRRQSESGASREASGDTSAAQSSTSVSENAGANGGFYQVAAGLVLQQQLYYLGTTDSAPGNSTSASQTGANQAVPDAGAITANATPPIANPATSGNTNTASAAAGGPPAANQSSSTLKQEEAQLQQALQDLGLNPPAAIQEFMHATQLLAEIAPGMFQEFVSYVTQLAEAAEPAAAASPASGAAAGATGVTEQAPAAAPASNADAPQIQLEVGSIQVTQAEVSITPNQNGGETLSVTAQSETASFAELQLGSPAPAAAPTSSATGNATAENTNAPALSATA